MGNIGEKTTGGGQPIETDRSTFTLASSTLEEEASTSSSINNKAPYRRYYPKSERGAYFHHHVSSSTNNGNNVVGATSAEFFTNSCPLFDQSSPLRKRLRANNNSVQTTTSITTQIVEETLSLPTVAAAGNVSQPLWSSTPAPNQSPYNHYNQPRRRQRPVSVPTPMSSNVPATNTPSGIGIGGGGGVSSVKNGGNNKQQSIVQNNFDACCDSDIVVDDEEESSAANTSLRRGVDCTSGGGGPITKAVISRGLKARFKSFSAWLLSEPAKASFPNSASFPSGFGGSLKRWSSLRASFNFGHHTTSKLRRETGSQHSSFINTPSKSSRRLTPQIEPNTSSTIGGQNSIASLNSLSDGRTPWPVPWLEAIFLPEFPSKGSVNEKTFTIIGTIAKGAFGKVYRVSLKASQEKIFAMKVQSKSDVITQNAIQQIKDEVSIHQTFADYPFIAQLYCTWQSRSKLYIVLQYVAGYGDLYQLWRDEGPFHEDAARIWGAELAMAIDFMHSNGVIYRDLKMENIMLDDDGHVQLVDFGLAKWLNYGDRTSTICGTLQYMAPEVLQGESYNHAVDWWSLGVLLHTLMIGSYPYSGADNHMSVKIDDYVPPATLSVEAQTLLSKLLRKDPNWRLRSFTVYKTQPFFKGVSFDAIRSKGLHPFDYIPRMRRCNTCNVVNEDLEGLEESDLAMFQEDYEALKNFDSFCGEEKL